MLVTIAADLGVPLAQAAAAASAYFLLYGLMQPVWGMLSDRLGRVRTMRLTMVGVLVPGLLSALAPSLAVLVVARALRGGHPRLTGVHRGHGTHLGTPEGPGRPAGDERDGDGHGDGHGGARRLPRPLAPRLRGAGR